MITDFIPNDRYISRAELVRLTGYTDRHVRQLIEDARRAGKRIVILPSHIEVLNPEELQTIKTKILGE